MIYTNINSIQIKEYSGALKNALEYMLANQKLFETQEAGKYEVDTNFFYIIQEYSSKESTIWESHRKYLDIQLIINGEEIIEVSDINHLESAGDYDEEKDFCGFEGKARLSVAMGPLDLTIFYPEDVHKPGLKTSKGSMPIKKCLFKVKI